MDRYGSVSEGFWNFQVKTPSSLVPSALFSKLPQTWRSSEFSMAFQGKSLQNLPTILSLEQHGQICRRKIPLSGINLWPGWLSATMIRRRPKPAWEGEGSFHGILPRHSCSSPRKTGTGTVAEVMEKGYLLACSQAHSQLATCQDHLPRGGAAQWAEPSSTN